MGNSTASSSSQQHVDWESNHSWLNCRRRRDQSTDLKQTVHQFFQERLHPKGYPPLRRKSFVSFHILPGLFDLAVTALQRHRLWLQDESTTNKVWKTCITPSNSWQHVDWGSTHSWSTTAEEELTYNQSHRQKRSAALNFELPGVSGDNFNSKTNSCKDWTEKGSVLFSKWICWRYFLQ